MTGNEDADYKDKLRAGTLMEKVLGTCQNFYNILLTGPKRNKWKSSTLIWNNLPAQVDEVVSSRFDGELLMLLGTSVDLVSDRVLALVLA